MFIDSLIKSHIAPFLAEHSFKRRKSTWNRPVDGIVHMVDLQASKWSAPGREESFTINVGVAVKVVSRVIEGKIPSFFKEWHCVQSVRIGDLIAGGDRKKAFDKWWDLKSQEDVAGVAADATEHIRAHCLPLLDRIRSLQDVKRFATTLESTARMAPGVKLPLAALCYLIGDFDQYEALRDELLNITDVWKKKMREVSSRLDLMDPSRHH